MERRVWVTLFISLVLILIMVGCSADTTVSNTINYRELKIIGDVETVINLGNIQEYEGLGFVENEITLNSILDIANPYNNDFNVLIVGNDGLMAEINGAKIDDCTLGYKDPVGWYSITKKHPVSTKIKDIKEIVIISNETDYDKGINIFTTEANIINITPGNLYLMRNEVFPYIDGKSKKEIDEDTYSVTVIKERKLLAIKGLLDIGVDQMLAFGGQGEYENISDGYLELFENQINYINIDTREYIKNLKGILVNPPNISNMDLYYDVEHYLSSDEDVLVFFVDGLSYGQFSQSSLSSIYKGKKANTVYKPVTNAGFAAMITGKPPIENGVLNRKYRDLKSDTIFDISEKLGKKAYLVEANLKILNTKLEPVLNIDNNKDGLLDDDIYRKSLELIEDKPNLMMVHFHSVDDFGHTFGDIADETLGEIELINTYIEDLKQKWEGQIIITADHGMHSIENGGYHGSARFEDIIIPYITSKGEKKQ